MLTLMSLAETTWLEEVEQAEYSKAHEVAT